MINYLTSSNYIIIIRKQNETTRNDSQVCFYRLQNTELGYIFNKGAEGVFDMYTEVQRILSHQLGRIVFTNFEVLNWFNLFLDKFLRKNLNSPRN